jgi:hypothetical protein
VSEKHPDVVQLAFDVATTTQPKRKKPPIRQLKRKSTKSFSALQTEVSFAYTYRLREMHLPSRPFFLSNRSGADRINGQNH